MSPNKIIFLLIINLLAKVFQCNCSTTKITAIEYFPHDKGLLTFATLKPVNSTITTANDYTYCLRANFKTWNFNSLVVDDKFSLRLFENGNGDIINGKTKHYFRWKDYFQVSYTSWNSFCVSFQSSNLQLTINGVRVYNSTEEKQNGPPELLVYQIILGEFRRLFSQYDFASTFQLGMFLLKFCCFRHFNFYNPSH